MVKYLHRAKVRKCAECGVRRTVHPHGDNGELLCNPCGREARGAGARREYERREAERAELERLAAPVRALTTESLIACGCGEIWTGDQFVEAVKSKSHKCEAGTLRRRDPEWRDAEELARAREQREGWREARFLARALGYNGGGGGHNGYRSHPRGATAKVPPIEAVPLHILAEARDRLAAREAREAAAEVEAAAA